MPNAGNGIKPGTQGWQHCQESLMAELEQAKEQVRQQQQQQSLQNFFSGLERAGQYLQQSAPPIPAAPPPPAHPQTFRCQTWRNGVVQCQ
jgi:hypothetical protein